MSLGVARLWRAFLAINHEISGALRIAGTAGSLARMAADVLLLRVNVITRLPSINRERTVWVRGNVLLTYRLNRGDIQSLREVWMDEAYRLPPNVQPETLVDLGANIGLTSVWFAKKYGCKHVLAVEPSAENARLARQNLLQNQIAAEVIEAAVGPRDGVTRFAAHEHSNLGSTLTESGVEVGMVSMESVLQRLGEDERLDVLKMDIEGAEQALLSGEARWLEHVGCIVAEFHPTLVDYPGLIRRLQREGFQYLKAGGLHRDWMDVFVRDRAGSPVAAP
jgi:FkbM family methyltransferase